MTIEQINDFISRLEHDLTGHRRCLDLVKTLLSESEQTPEYAMKLLTESIKKIELTETWISSVKNTFVVTKPENGISL